MDNRAIGILDAGFSGLAAVRELCSLLPHEDIVYYSDITHFPYEKENADSVREYVCRGAEFLAEKDVKLILNVCDCGCPEPNDDILCMGMQLPAAQAACSSTRNGKIGIIGSTSAAQSGTISKAVKTIRPGTSVIGSISTLVSPAVLGGYPVRNPDLFSAVLEDCISPLRNEGADTMILGNMFFEFTAELVRAAVGAQVTVVSPVHEAVRAAELMLFERGMLSENSGAGNVSYFINGNHEFFKEHASRLCGGRLNGKICGCTVV